MKEIRRLTITVTHRRTLHLPELPVRAHCPVCGRVVTTLDVTQAAVVLAVTPAQFEGLLAAAALHALPTVSGSVRICQDSLFQPRRSS